MNGTNPQRNGRIRACDDDAIAEAATLLRAGKIVAVPTETVYGLAADASNAAAVAAIYRTKGRPDFNPLIVHVADVAAARQLAVFDPRAETLAAQFWPGPLTMVLPARPGARIAAAVTAGLSTIALRCSAHPVMQALLDKSGLCLAAPSANRSGHISPTCAAHVLDSLRDAAPMILDGGQCAAGLESTIVALRPAEWQILRHGPVTADDLIAVLNSQPAAITNEKIEAPGQMAMHYAPAKRLRLNAITAEEGEYLIGFGIVPGDSNLSVSGDLAEAAAGLFAALHIADASASRTIAAAPIPCTGIGAAINDRLSRAAAR
jgi:L-threonylcarbamoyladenylate synthase